MFGLAIIGANATNWLNISLSKSMQVIITIGLALAYIYVAVIKVTNSKHVFEEGSPEFLDFFSKWYSQDGSLYIFCSDLFWLDKPNCREIVNQLKRKGNNLNLYLRKHEGKIFNELSQSGSQVYKIKVNTRTQHRLSIIDNDGVRKIIIRNKDIETDSIAFIESDDQKDPYLVSLALDLLDDCYETS